ncbi:hypothetical protein GC207_12590 [bacterium]|nr:hypothetical protein [bacterium]
MSDDGLNWIRAKSPFFVSGSQAAAGSKTIVMAGASYSPLQIVQSVPETTATRHLSGVQALDTTIQVNVSGDAGTSVQLDGTSSLGPTAAWQPLTTIPVSPTPRPVVFVPPTGSATFFLRANPVTP